MSKQLGFELKADGTVYILRNGKEVTLRDILPTEGYQDVYKFHLIDSCGYKFLTPVTGDGKYIPAKDLESVYDVVALKQPTEQPTEQPNDFVLKADGTVYLTREGKEVPLTSHPGNWHKFVGSNHLYYGENGGLYSDGGACQRDIVSVKVTSHPHAELMLEYANDAKTTDKPWLLWEYYNGEWVNLHTNPIWIQDVHYRRKPKQKPMIKIGEFTVPQSLRVKPKRGADYYVLTISYIVGYTWKDGPLDNEYFSDSRCYETKEDAEQVRQAILSLLKK